MKDPDPRLAILQKKISGLPELVWPIPDDRLRSLWYRLSCRFLLLQVRLMQAFLHSQRNNRCLFIKLKKTGFSHAEAPPAVNAGII